MTPEPGTRSATAGMTAERIARNEAIFRDANDRIFDAAAEHGMIASIPFVCECADPQCRALVQLSLDEYAAIRRDPRLFVGAVGHEQAAQEWGDVVAQNDGHVLVKKRGKSGNIAAALADADDPATAPAGGEADPVHERGEPA